MDAGSCMDMMVLYVSVGASIFGLPLSLSVSLCLFV